VNKDFGMTGNTADLQYLTQAMLGGKIRRKRSGPNCKRRGVLSDDFDPEDGERLASRRRRRNSTPDAAR
jgi:hypothetical protein